MEKKNQFVMKIQPEFSSSKHLSIAFAQPYLHPSDEVDAQYSEEV